MTEQEYSEVKAIRASFLKACSFGAYQGWKYLNGPAYESDAMEFGTMVHCALLEPDTFNERYVTIPMDAPKKLTKPQDEAFAKFATLEKPTKAQVEANQKSIRVIEWWKAFDEKNQGRIVISPDDLYKVEMVKRKCMDIPAVKDALREFEKEKTIVWDGNKARLDLVNMDARVVIDIKTTRDGSAREFTSQLLALRYDIQMLHYALASKATTVYAIVIESETAEVALYDMTDIVFSDFTKKRYLSAYENALEVQQMTECPPKFKPEIVNLTLPKWAVEESV